MTLWCYMLFLRTWVWTWVCDVCAVWGWIDVLGRGAGMSAKQGTGRSESFQSFTLLSQDQGGVVMQALRQLWPLSEVQCITPKRLHALFLQVTRM
jgi:hypothetical protein